MLRAILAVIVPYIVVGLLIMLVFLGAMLALGLEGTLRPGEYWTTGTFNAVVIVGGAAASAIGGMLSALIARSMRPAWIVAAIMLTVGLVGAVGNMNKPDPPARPAPTPGESRADALMRVMKEMPKVGKEPLWFSFTVPVVGAAAFVLGAGLVANRRRGATATRP